MIEEDWRTSMATMMITEMRKKNWVVVVVESRWPSHPRPGTLHITIMPRHVLDFLNIIVDTSSHHPTAHSLHRISFLTFLHEFPVHNIDRVSFYSQDYHNILHANWISREVWFLVKFFTFKITRHSKMMKWKLFLLCKQTCLLSWQSSAFFLSRAPQFVCGRPGVWQIINRLRVWS